MNLYGAAYFALRLGLAFAFLYPPLNALVDPLSWIGYFPPFLRGYVPDLLLLHAFGAVEIVLAVWILSGWRIFWPSLAAAGMLLSIVVFNPGNIQVLFRDISLAAMALALAMLSYGHDRNAGGASLETRT
ncbi:hypothetical protein HY417_03125 [Candidatus Kaiserbacteria bacterium]|nr:hypothetical protein [Candidatus Kaiserbacteria bacterium]